MSSVYDRKDEALADSKLKGGAVRGASFVFDGVFLIIKYSVEETLFMH